MSTTLYQRHSDKMTVKSLYTGEIKKIDNNAIPAFEKVDFSLVRDDRLTPKQNYSKVDSRIQNINAHKGPDEL